AISFVGGEKAGRYIHNRGTLNGKRVQSNMAAKNHATILPDANKEQTLKALAGAAFGAAGQRCMALSAAVFVGESNDWVPELVEIAKKFKVGSGMDPSSDLGPLINRDALSRAESIIATAEKQGAKIVLDGRKP